jgi:type IV pilus assembly protein PilB
LDKKRRNLTGELKMLRAFEEKLLNYLKEKEIISQEIYNFILDTVKTTNNDLQQILLEHKFLTYDDLVRILSEILNWKIINSKDITPDPSALKVIPSFITNFYKFIPFKVEGRTIHVGFTIPVKPTAIDDITLLTGYSVIPYILTEEKEILEEVLENITSEIVSKEESLEEAKVIEINEEEIKPLEEIIQEIEDEEKKKTSVMTEEVEEKKEEVILEEAPKVEQEEKKDRSKEIADKIFGAVREKIPRQRTMEKSEIETKIPRRRRLGEILLEEGFITKEQLEKALDESVKRGKPLGEVLLDLKFIDDIKLAQALSIQLGIPFKSLREVKIDPDVAKLINFSKARQDLILPLYREKNKVFVAIVDPSNIMALDEIKMVIKGDIEPIIVPKGEFLDVINRLWTTQETEKLIEDIVRVKEEETPVQEISEDVESEEGPTAKLVNSVLFDAITLGASDIHVEPMEDCLRIRFRIDGRLQEYKRLPRRIQANLISRIKIISNMDIAERRKPQDGRIKMIVRGNTYDFRVSTLPGVFGEKAVLRILGRGEISLSLESLGFSDENYNRYLKMLKSPYGIILVTGPTGSGKSTTLYASLNMINSPEINIITVEDPVEYQLPGIHQVQVNPQAGLTFANALRSILRQDPDVVLVGEIRDEETARIAIQAALTGHLVLSTLHTNDAPSAVTRLIDMGIEPFLISSSLLGAVAQRLVRKICPKCKAPYKPTEEDLEVLKSNLYNIDFDLNNLKLYKGEGCPFCNNKGYKGRTAIHEIMLVDDEIRELILKKVPKDVIRDTARRKGMTTLREDGLMKVLKGITTIEEVMRVTAAD